MKKTAITPTRAENYPEWYQQVILNAEMAENSPVRGCMVIKPWGYAIWENIQKELDNRFKATGHVNAYFPLLIPLSYFEQEAKHVEGFAKECAVVTHHGLKEDGQGGLVPDGPLDEPLVVRPTSETIIGKMFAKWVQSYRDLPLLINQWANVMRWEMRTRLFLRTAEFLWQEGHTAHTSATEAMQETLTMLDVYAEFAETCLAMPVIKGEKTQSERFPGAVNTYCIEAMMQDKKALQAGTSHFLGQNFAKAAEIQFLNQQGQQEYAWTTSWGTSTRLIGGLIMTHSDDNGLVLPPKISPQQIIILPIIRGDQHKTKILDYCQQLKKQLSAIRFEDEPIRVQIDHREIHNPEKNWQWIKKGVPIRLEIGMREVDSHSVYMARRDIDSHQKQAISVDAFSHSLPELLADIQSKLLNKAKKHLADHTQDIHHINDFKDFFAQQAGFAYCYAIDDPVIEKTLSDLKVSARCVPFGQHQGKCIFTGQYTDKKIIFAKAY